ncbi:MAG: DNA gyrase subunit A, partial [Dehalococcoidia bacterium]
NFGSVDNDPPAAMRYTEARLAPIAQEMLADIDKDTVDFAPNFDDSLREPAVLPARLPNLLVNGATGIAVGMATNIPPHNLSEVCDAIAHLIDKPDATTEELIKVVPGPDFPTAALIFGREGIRNAYTTGHGRIVMRARVQIEEMARSGRQQIVVLQLPYQTNKAALVEKIADLVREKRTDGIADIRDESDRHGMRIVIELKRDGQARQVLNFLYKHTAMQSAFAVNMLALVDGQPKTITLKGALERYIDFRRLVIRRRSQYDLDKAKEREHILQGLLTALENLDAVIQAIRRSESAEKARERLMRAPFRLSQRQAQAVLEMQLRRLAALERRQLQEEYAQVIQQIAYLEDLLANPRKIDFLVKEEVQELRKKHGDGRRTQIVEQEAQEFSEEDMVPHREMVVTLSARGYIKRIPAETYRPQRRGGRGITGMVTRENDAVRHLLVADTHHSLLFFTDRGRVYQVRTYELPEETRQARGIPLVNLIHLEQGETITAVVAVASFDQDYMVLATRRGEVKKSHLSDFAAVRRSGLVAMDLEPGDELVGAILMVEKDHVLLVSGQGQAIRFAVAGLRTASRQSGGVRGMRLVADDYVVALEAARPGQHLLVVSANGHGKRTPLDQYPTKGRGGAGVATFKPNAHTGPLAAARVVNGAQELMILSADGIVLRTPVENISTQGRSTQGVKLMEIAPGDAVASIACVDLTSKPGRPTAAEGRQNQ